MSPGNSKSPFVVNYSIKSLRVRGLSTFLIEPRYQHIILIFYPQTPILWIWVIFTIQLIVSIEGTMRQFSEVLDMLSALWQVQFIPWAGPRAICPQSHSYGYFSLGIGGHLLDLEKPTDELQADWAWVLGVISRSQDHIAMSGIKEKANIDSAQQLMSQFEAIPTIFTAQHG